MATFHAPPWWPPPATTFFRLIMIDAFDPFAIVHSSSFLIKGRTGAV